jgi:hypothetical protein
MDSRFLIVMVLINFIGDLMLWIFDKLVFDLSRWAMIGIAFALFVLSLVFASALAIPPDYGPAPVPGDPEPVQSSTTQSPQETEPKVPGPGDYSHLLTKSRFCTEMKELLQGLPGEIPNTGGYHYISRDRGLEALFRQDSLEKVVYHSQRSEGFSPFSGTLPEGISFTDTKSNVHLKLGPATMGKDGNSAPDRYERPQYVLDIEYGEDQVVLRVSMTSTKGTLLHHDATD